MSEEIESASQQSEDLQQKFTVGGWKFLLLYQFEVQYSATVIILVFMHYIISVWEAVRAIALPEKDVPTPYGNVLFYGCDVLYFFDLLVMVMFRNTDWENVKYIHRPRNRCVLFVEFLTLIPIDGIYCTMATASLKTVYLFRLRYALRCVRLLSYYNQSKKYIGSNALIMHACILCLLLCFFVVNTAAILYLIYCSKADCSEGRVFVNIIYGCFTKFTNFGAQHVFRTTHTFHGFFLVIFPVLVFKQYHKVLIICDFLRSLDEKCVRIRQYEQLKVVLRGFRTGDNLRGKFKSAFRSLYNQSWPEKRSIATTDVTGRHIPEIMFKEIALDLYWSALKHTHLFRYEGNDYLRLLASLMRHSFLVPGEVIYQKNQFKSKMIYVMSGVIEILSEEDNESPIISLSEGTCLGESTLLIDYPSKSSVITKTNCELAVLDRRKFVLVSKYYPKKFADTLDRIRRRHRFSEQFLGLAKYQLQLDEHSMNMSELKMRWLKYILRKLLNHFIKTDNKYLLDKLDKLTYCARYINMIVVAKEVELITNTIFLKTTFPYIFQPNSILLKLWKTFMCLLSLTFNVLYVYFVSVAPEITNTYLLFHIIVTVVYAFDLYIQSSTAIKTKTTFCTTIMEILEQRSSDHKFLIDIVSTIPFGLIYFMMYPKTARRIFLAYECHKLIRIYIIGELMLSYRGKSLTNMSILHYATFVTYLLLLCYHGAGMFHNLACFDNKCDPTYAEILKAEGAHSFFFGFYSTVMFFCNFERRSDTVLLNIFGLLVFQVCFYAFHVCFVTYSCAGQILKLSDHYKLRDYIRNLHTSMESASTDHRMQEQVFRHVQIMYQYDKINFLHGDSIYNLLPRNMFLIIRNELFARFLRNVPLFSHLDKHDLDKFAFKVVKHVYPKFTLITFSGEICSEMHIITFGSCRASCGLVSKIIGPGEAFSVLEMCAGLPAINTVVTLTTCEIISLSYADYYKVLLQNQTIREEINSTLSEFRDEIELKMQDQEETCGSLDLDICERESDKELVYFEPFGKPPARVFHQYRKSFPRLLRFTRYLLLPLSFTSYSKFVFYWELFRCLSAFVSCFLTPINPLSTCASCFARYLLICCDVISWIDIYLQHHVCHFTSEGIEVTHPFYTARYYWTHSFLADLLAAFPLDFFYRRGNVKVVFLLKLNRLVQVYRIFGLLQRSGLFAGHLRALEIFKDMPLLILIINFLASIFFNYYCSFGNEEFTCRSDSWLQEFVVETTMASGGAEVYAYALFFASCIFCNTFCTFIITTLTSEKTFLIAMALAGYVTFVYIGANTMAIKLSTNYDLLFFRESMQQLRKFMQYRRIDERLRHEIVCHFRYVWYKMKGKFVHRYLRAFPVLVQETVLYNTFGKAFTETKLFSVFDQALIKNLLPKGKHEVILKSGIVYRVNDVHGRLYFLLHGQIEIVGPDNNHLDFLHRGSFLGNLDNCKLSRQTVTAVAYTNIELLSFASTEFFEVLSRYPSARKRFLRKTYFNVDYMENEGFTADVENVLANSKVRSAKSSAINLFYMHWQKVSIFACFVTYILELYNMVTVSVWWVMPVVMYSLDFMHLVKIILEFYTPYESEFGTLIENRNLISARYIKRHFGFLFDLCSIIPLEIISLLFVNSDKYFVKLWSYLRFNRLLRIISVIKYFRLLIQNIRTNSFLIRLIYLSMMMLLVLMNLACFNYLLNSFHRETTTPKRKMLLFVHDLFVVLSASLKVTLSYSFENLTAQSVLFVSILNVFGRYIYMYFIAELMSIVQMVNFNKFIYQKIVIKLEEYMKNDNISQPIVERISNYMASLWVQCRGLQFPDFVEEAPYYLKEALLYSLFGLHLRKHPQFNKCHVDLIRQISARIKTRTFFPDDVIVYQGDIDHCMYFVHEGEVQSLTEDTIYSEAVKDVLGPNEMFGFEQGMYLRCGHEYTYKVSKFSVILVLKREDWFFLLDFYPASRYMIYDNKRDK